MRGVIGVNADEGLSCGQILVNVINTYIADFQTALTHLNGIESPQELKCSLHGDVKDSTDPSDIFQISICSLQWELAERLTDFYSKDQESYEKLDNLVRLVDDFDERVRVTGVAEYYSSQKVDVRREKFSAYTQFFASQLEMLSFQIEAWKDINFSSS